MINYTISTCNTQHIICLSVTWIVQFNQLWECRCCICKFWMHWIGISRLHKRHMYGERKGNGNRPSHIIERMNDIANCSPFTFVDYGDANALKSGNVSMSEKHVRRTHKTHSHASRSHRKWSANRTWNELKLKPECVWTRKMTVLTANEQRTTIASRYDASINYNISHRTISILPSFSSLTSPMLCNCIAHGALTMCHNLFIVGWCWSLVCVGWCAS